MITISVCMIVKDEEAVLKRCLSCVKQFADEIIIVDTGSMDSTKEIAKRYTEKIYDYVWNDNFSEARNFSFSKANMDYIFWLDADDVINKEACENILCLKKELHRDVDAVMMKYVVSVDENNHPLSYFYRERMVKRECNFNWIGIVHECLNINGNIVYSPIKIFHDPKKTKDTLRNLSLYEKQKEKNILFTARDLYYYGKELYEHKEYQKALSVLKQVLNKNIWIEYKIGACEILGRIYQILKDKENALLMYFQSFLYDEPRAEICCCIGECFMYYEEYKEAVFWYQLALKRNRKDKEGAFIREDCYEFLPSIQLCVCYWMLHDKEKSSYYHTLSKIYRPKHPAVLYNDKIFQ